MACDLEITLEQLLEFLVANHDVLTAILLYHVLDLVVFSAGIKQGLTYDIETLKGKTVDILRKRCKLKVRDQLCRKAKVLLRDVFGYQRGCIYYQQSLVTVLSISVIIYF